MGRYDRTMNITWGAPTHAIWKEHPSHFGNIIQLV